MLGYKRDYEVQIKYIEVVTVKIGILGHFARNTDLCDGQTVKTRNIEKALLSKEREISIVDSFSL